MLPNKYIFITIIQYLKYAFPLTPPPPTSKGSPEKATPFLICADGKGEGYTPLALSPAPVFCHEGIHFPDEKVDPIRWVAVVNQTPDVFVPGGTHRIA